MENALLLYDQAYFEYQTMDLIDANDGMVREAFEGYAQPRIVDELKRMAWQRHLSRGREGTGYSGRPAP